MLDIYEGFLLIQNILALGVISNSLILNDYSHLFYNMIPHGLIEIFGMVFSVTAVAYCFYQAVYAVPAIVKSNDVMLTLVHFLLAITVVEVLLFSIVGIVEMFMSFIQLM